MYARFSLVIDPSNENDQIEDDRFPLSNIAHISGDTRKKKPQADGFINKSGHYHLTHLPKGIKIYPAVFSRVMRMSLVELSDNRCLVYLDDLIIFVRTLTEHNKILIELFERLREVNLKITPNKCHFLRRELLHLDNIISKKALSLGPEKSRAIKEFPLPKNSDEVKHFIAFPNYYRMFIPNFATIAIPLNRLLKYGI